MSLRTASFEVDARFSFIGFNGLGIAQKVVFVNWLVQTSSFVTIWTYHCLLEGPLVMSWFLLVNNVNCRHTCFIDQMGWGSYSHLTLAQIQPSSLLLRSKSDAYLLGVECGVEVPHWYIVRMINLIIFLLIVLILVSNRTFLKLLLNLLDRPHPLGALLFCFRFIGKLVCLLEVLNSGWLLWVNLGVCISVLMIDREVPCLHLLRSRKLGL